MQNSKPISYRSENSRENSITYYSNRIHKNTDNIQIKKNKSISLNTIFKNLKI